MFEWVASKGLFGRGAPLGRLGANLDQPGDQFEDEETTCDEPWGGAVATWVGKLHASFIEILDESHLIVKWFIDGAGTPKTPGPVASSSPLDDW